MGFGARLALAAEQVLVELVDLLSLLLDVLDQVVDRGLDAPPLQGFRVHDFDAFGSEHFISFSIL